MRSNTDPARLSRAAEMACKNMDWQLSAEKKAAFDRRAEKAMERVVDVNAEEILSDQLQKDVVFRMGKMKLYHYSPLVSADKISKVPTLVVYALINRQYMMDIQPDRSVIKHFLDGGMDVYVIDWGYPKDEDEYISLDDYIEWYLNSCVDFVRNRHGLEKINLLGVCQGGTFSIIYTSLHQEKIKNLVTMVVPVNFDAEDALLFRWCKHADVDSWRFARSVLPGSVLNYMFMYLKPITLNISKYIDMIEKAENPAFLENFLRMENWTFDCPGQTAGMLIQCMGDLFQKNKLIKGEFKLKGQPVDTRQITCPLLCLCADYDHIVPYSATAPLFDIVSSRDKEFIRIKTGHIGMYVSTSSQNAVSPKIIQWLDEHCKDNK